MLSELKEKGRGSKGVYIVAGLAGHRDSKGIGH